MPQSPSSSVRLPAPWRSGEQKMSGYWTSHVQDMTPACVFDRWNKFSENQSICRTGSAQKKFESHNSKFERPLPLSPLAQKCLARNVALIESSRSSMRRSPSPPARSSTPTDTTVKYVHTLGGEQMRVNGAEASAPSASAHCCPTPAAPVAPLQPPAFHSSALAGKPHWFSNCDPDNMFSTGLDWSQLHDIMSTQPHSSHTLATAPCRLDRDPRHCNPDDHIKGIPTTPAA